MVDGLQPFLQDKGLCSLGKESGPFQRQRFQTDHLSNIKTLTGFPDYYSLLFLPTLEACKPFFLFNQEFAQGNQCVLTPVPHHYPHQYP